MTLALPTDVTKTCVIDLKVFLLVLLKLQFEHLMVVISWGPC